MPLKKIQLSDDFSEEIKNPKFRKKLYFEMVKEPIFEYQEVLLQLLEIEIQYRDDLWNGKIKDTDDLYENIYRCAFLLYKIDSLEAVFLIWKAKRLNMDVGFNIDVHHFLGAGYEKTIDFLSKSKHKDAGNIELEIFDFDEEEYSFSSWEKDMLALYF